MNHEQLAASPPSGSGLPVQSHEAPSQDGQGGRLSRAMLILGTLLLASGLISFFAFNWQAISPARKFGLLAATMVLSALAAHRPGGPARKATLFLAFVATGVLLATIGQTYQTGADAWQLFAVWAMLGVLWALASGSALIWVAVFLLMQLAVLRFVNLQFGLLEFLFKGLEDGRAVMPLALAWALLAIWEFAWRRRPALGISGMAGSRLQGLLILGLSVWAGLDGLWGQADGRLLAAGFASLMALAAWCWWVRRDLPLLGFVLLGLDGLLVSALGRGMRLRDIGDGLMLGLVFVGLAAGIVTWLRKALPATRDPAGPAHPWFLSVIMGVAAWFGAALLLGFIGSLVLVATSTFGDRGTSWLVIGLALLAAGWALIGRSDNMMRQQFGLALGLAGQASVVWALVRYFGDANLEHSSLFAFSLLVMYALLIALVRHNGHRFFCVLGWWSSACFLGFTLLGDEQWSLQRFSFYVPLLVTLALSLGAMIVLQRSRAGKVLGPAAVLGTMAAIVLGVFVFGEFLPRIDGLFRFNRTPGATGWFGPWSGFQWWSAWSSALLALASLITGWSLTPARLRVSAVIAAVLALAGLAQAPFLFVGLLFLAQALHAARGGPASGGSSKVLGLLGVLFGLAGFSSFYYSLAWPLWFKSLVLAALGLVLLVTRQVWLSRKPAQVAPATAPPKPGMFQPVLLAALLVSLGAASWGIYSKEQIIRSGERVYLALAPVDPRSLMQGDYMALRFALAGDIRIEEESGQDEERPPVWGRTRFRRDGVVDIVLDERRIASLAAGSSSPSGNTPGRSLMLRYQKLDARGRDSIQISTNAWFFQEGQAARFEKARYGEFAVDASGQALLVGMRDENLSPLPLAD